MTGHPLAAGDGAPPRIVPLDGEALAEVVGDLLARGASVRVVARGGSMSPWIRDGDILTIHPRGIGGAPRPGDVVVFRRPAGERLVVHRLVSRAPGGWVARGDRCSRPDGFIASTEILGTVDRATCGAGRRLLPQGLLGLVASSASRAALDLRDRIRAARRTERSGTRQDRA